MTAEKRTDASAAEEAAEDPVLFEARPKKPFKELYGRYAVVVIAHGRRLFAAIYPAMVWLLVSMTVKWFETGGVFTPDHAYPSTMSDAVLSRFWPIMPIVSPLILILWPVSFFRISSESYFVRRFEKHGPEERSYLNLTRHHITRSGERYAARVEARADHMDVEDHYVGIIVPAGGYLKRRSYRRHFGWVRFRYDQIVCAWYAPDLVVLRLCWGPDLDQVWDVVIDRPSFVKGDAEAFIAHIEPRFRLKYTSYRGRLDDARWSSPYASPNVFFRQRLTKAYRVRWPRPKRRKADGA